MLLFRTSSFAASTRILSTAYLRRAMSTMKAVVVEETGGVDKLLYKDIPRPSAQANSVLIKNHVIGVNYIDTYHRSGLYKLPLPFVVGRESAGEVVQVGDGVSDFKVGDRVVYIGGDTYAEYSVAKTDNLEKIKNNVDYETIAAVGLQGLTAWTMVRDGYPVKKGDYILVHAAAGGVGLILCQLCHYLGATVIGTVSNAEKAELAKANGADYIIDYTKEDVVARVNEITNNLGCHAVLDGVGKSTFETSLACARRLGTVISFGNASGAVPPISLLSLSAKNLKVMRPTLFNYLVTKEEREKWWGELFDLLSQGVIKPHIYKVYNLKDAQQAHIDIESRKTTGKLLIKP